LERLAPDKTRDIDLKRFVNQDAIPPVYFERGYFLTPAANSDKAYKLLAEAMAKTGQAGIATFVMFAHPKCLNTFRNGVFIGEETPASY